MCDMAHSYVWHNSLIWRIHTCTTCSGWVRCNAVCVTQFTHMTHSCMYHVQWVRTLTCSTYAHTAYVWQNSLVWLIHICTYVWHNSLIWLIHVCTMCRGGWARWRGVCVTKFTCMTHSYMYICVTQFTCMTHSYMYVCVTQFTHMTHSYIYVQWVGALKSNNLLVLIHMCDMTHSYDAFICAPCAVGERVEKAYVWHNSRIAHSYMDHVQWVSGLKGNKLLALIDTYEWVISDSSHMMREPYYEWVTHS